MPTMTNHPYCYGKPADSSNGCHTVYIRWDWRAESYIVVVLTESAREIKALGGHRILFTVGGAHQRISCLHELHAAAGNWFDMSAKLSRVLTAQRQLSMQERHLHSQTGTSAEKTTEPPL